MKNAKPLPRVVLRGLLALALSGAGVATVSTAALAGSRSASTTLKAHSGTTVTKYRLWVLKRQAIATVFRNAVASARAAFNLAQATATTSADRYAARTVFDAAIAQAAQRRSAALIALGPPPKFATRKGMKNVISTTTSLSPALVKLGSVVATKPLLP